jgi:hypothetical protein
MKLWRSLLVAVLFAVPELANACDICCAVEVKCCHRRYHRLRHRRVGCCCWPIVMSPACDHSDFAPSKPGDPPPEPQPMPPIQEPPFRPDNPSYQP